MFSRLRSIPSTISIFTNDSASAEPLTKNDDQRQEKPYKWASKRWHAAPVALRKWDWSRCLSIVLDLVLLCLALVFAAFGIAVKILEGSPVEGSIFDLLQRTAKLAPTIFPIMFAAITGRALRAVARWQIEKGARVGYLDQLIGSTSIVTAVTTQISLRSPNLLTVALLVGWALSPLGGQGSIRVLTTGMRMTNTTMAMQYLNVTDENLYTLFAGDNNTSGSSSLPNALFAASLSSPARIKSSPVDIWGNAKIPMLEMLDASTADVDGWIVPGERNVSYASLIGLPISTLLPDRFTSLNVETSYWYFSCPSLQWLNLSGWEAVMQCGGHDWYSTTPVTHNDNVPGMFLSSDRGARSHLSISPTDFRRVAYCGSDGSRLFTGANCTVASSYVEAHIECDGLSCAVKRIRRSTVTHSPTSYTQLDAPSYSQPDNTSSSFVWFGNLLARSLGTFSIQSGSPFQRYLIHPDNPFKHTYTDSVYTLDPTIFQVRLSQVFNTYSSALLGAVTMQGGVGTLKVWMVDLVGVNISTTVKDTIGVSTESCRIILCDHSWLVILLLSVALLVVLSILGIITTSLTLGPDLGINIASLIKDSPYVTIQTGSSVMPPGDRSRMLKDIKVKFGDILGDEDIGYATVAACTGSDYPQALKVNRLYG